MKRFTGDEWQPPQQVSLIPDIGLTEVRIDEEVSGSLGHRVRECGDALLWLADEAPEGGFDALQDGVEFEHMESWAEGRRDSVQGVFFGYLALNRALKVPVAVKPYRAIGAGVHETATLLHLEGSGLPVYSVLGASWSREQGYCMISAFEESSISLDNIDWRKDLREPLGSHLTNLEAIKQIGQSLGLLHGNGIRHGDAQVKNFAVIDDRVVLIDLAQARTYRQDDFVDEVRLQAMMFRDLTTLLESLNSKGFLGDATAKERRDFFESIMATSYRSGMYQAQVAGGCGLNDAVTEEVIASVIESYYSPRAHYTA